MSDIVETLGSPKDLSHTRAVAHKAVQFLTAAARANLAPEPDDSHSNLEWSPQKQAFLSHHLPVESGTCQVGYSPSTMHLVFVCSDGQSRQLDLTGRRFDEAMAWLDEQLVDEGLAPSSGAKIPYPLPQDVAGVDVFPGASGLAMDALSAWYSLAVEALEALVRRLDGITPGPSPIRCWPHHFDIATYVSLEEGDPETARGIGVGLSPGDAAYDQPYFYVNPWPHPQPDAAPAPIAPGHWHSEGFFGAVATGEEIKTLPDIEAGTAAFVHAAFDANRKLLAR